MKRINGHFISPVPAFRKIAMGAWGHPTDPSIYAATTINTTAIHQYIRLLSETGIRMTLYQVLIAALSRTLSHYPELNRCIIRGSLYQRDSVGIFIPVPLKSHGGDDLFGCRISNAHSMDPGSLVSHMKQAIRSLHHQTDRPINRIKAALSWCPQWLSRPLIFCLNLIYHTANLTIPGLPDDRFGSVIFSDLSAFGFESAFIPLFPFSRASLSVSLGTEKHVDHDWFCTLSFTADHRVFDGRIAGKAYRYFLKLIATPDLIFD